MIERPSHAVIEIVLSVEDVAYAEQKGAERQSEAVKAGMKDRHGLDPKQGLARHIEGALGEVACRRALGVDPRALSVNTFKTPDIPPDVQVRMRTVGSHALIVRRDDDRTDRFVHVTGQSPRFKVWGWILGGDAMEHPEWVRSYGLREPAWFVEKEDLMPLAELQGFKCLPYTTPEPTPDHPF